MSVSYSSLKKEVLSNKKKSFDDEDLTYQELKERTKAAHNTYGVDENYINSFVKDANSYISSAQSDIEKLNYQNAKDQYDQRSSRSAELKSRANTIRAYLNANKDRVDSNSRNQLLSFIDGFDKQSDDIFNNFMRAAQRVSQFPSETEYNFDLNNNIEKTKRETLPRIAQQVAEDYLQNRMGYDTIAKYDDNTRYSDVSSDIEHLKQLRGGAARRDKDTGVYDRALEMLKSYASQNYSLDDPSLSLEDRNAIYNQNERDIADLSGEGNDEYTHDYSLMRWLGMYDKNALSSDEANQTAIDLINKNNVKYDVSLDVGDLNDEEKKKKADELRTYFKNKYGYTDDTDYLAAANDFYKSKKAKYEKAKVDNKAYERLGQASAVTSDINKKDDYEQNSIAGDYGTPTTRDEINEYFNTVNSEKVEAAKTGYERVKAKSEIDSNVLPDKLGSFMAAEDKEIAKTPNTYVQIRQDIAGAGVAVDNYDRLKSEGYKNHWEAMNGEEIGAYYYLLNTEGKDAAYEYLDSLSSTLQKRANYENKKKEMELSGEQGTLTNLDWIVRNASTVPDKVVGGVAGYIDNASHYITGEDLEPYSNIHGASLSATATREAAGETLDKKLGADGTSRWAVKPSQLYQGVMSAADMATAMIVGPEAYGASMGMSAAEDTARELWEQGEDNDTINAISTAAGTAEMLFEELSLDKIIKISNLAGESTAKGLVKNYLLNMVKSSGIEASEEVLTEAANMVVDYAVRGDRSDEAGYSFADVANRLYQAGVGGAIGGLLGGGGATTLSAVAKGAEIAQDTSRRNKYIAATGTNISNTGNIQNLIDKASEIDNEEVKAQLAKVEKAQEKNNESKLIEEAGKLYSVMQTKNLEAYDNASKDVVKAAIQAAYANEAGVDVSSDIATKASDAIYKAKYTDEQLDSYEKRIVSESASQKAYEAVKNDSSVAEKITTAQIRAMNNLTSTAALTQEKEKPKSDAEVLNNASFDIHEDDGKAYTKDGQKQVDLASVASVSDNDISFSLKNGGTENLNNLDLPKQQAVLAQSIIDVQKDTGISLTPEVANTIFQEYDKVKDNYKSVGAYMLDARKVLFNGYTNNTAPDSTIKLPQSLRNRLYSMGRRLSETSTASQQNAVRARINEIKTRKGAVSFRDGMSLDGNGKVSYEESGKTYKLDPMRQASVDLLSMTGESLGFDIVFYRSTKDGKGRFSSKYVTDNKFVKAGQQAPSGFWRGGKMYIDVNAGMNGEGLILFTASHELVHMIREGSPEDFKALADFLVQSYSEKGTDINDLIRAEMAKSTNLTRDEAYEEVIADACESFLRDTLINGKSQTLYRENPTLWTKIKNALRTIIDRLKSLKPQSEASRKTLKLGVEKLETAYDLFTRGVERSAQNLRSMEGSYDSKSKYLIRRDVDGNKFVDVDKSIYDSSNGEMVAQVVSDIIKNKFNNLITANGQKIKVNKTTNQEWRYSKSAQQLKNSDPVAYDNKMYAIGNADEILEASKEWIGEQNKHLRKDKLIEFARGNVLYRVGNNGYIADVVVGIYPDGSALLYDLVNIHTTEITEAPDTDTGDSRLSSRQNASVTTDSILQQSGKSNNNLQNNAKQKNKSRSDSEYLSAVERGDMETAQRMVDEAAERAFAKSKIRDEDGKLMKVYHGTDADFTVFRRDKIGSTGRMEGSGFNFTPYKDRAKSYGGKVLAGYLNIEQPLNAQTKTISVQELANLIKEIDPTGDNIIANYAHNTNDYGTQAFINRESLVTAKEIWNWAENDVDLYSELSTANPDAETLIEKFSSLGYDGLIHYADDGSIKTAVSFSSEQFKSADPVTYDNDGNVIPLSERFNDSEQDIRYKSRLSAYDAFSELSEEGKNETIDILSRLANGQAIPLKLINNTELFVNAYSQRGELNETININTPQRERLRKEVQKKIENLGSAVEKDNKILYNGDVKREYRADIVIGLPSAGKSSVLVDPLSAVYGSRIVDSDMVKELLPEYNNGLGAGNVHEESKKINERILKHSCENGENIVMPIVGSDANGVIRRINFLKSKGYDVYLHLNELPMYKALGRMITRYIEKGRYLSPAIIYDYQNKPTEVFEQIIKQKGDLLSGYSRYSNDVEYGERPIFKEGTEDYYKTFSGRYRENIETRGRDLRESREGLSGLTTKYQSREDNQFQDFEISDWEYDDTTADTIAREYVSHYEDIGEVLKNISDIDITPAKVTSIVNRVLRENIGNLDKTTRELLSTEVQIALDRVNRDDPATVINNMTQAVRDAIENAYIPNEKAEDDYKELLSVFKGKRFYLSAEQLGYLKEHDSSLGKIHRELQNRVNIVDKNNLKRSVNGGYQNAQELSLEGLYDVLESPGEYLSYKRNEWDEYGYKAPFIIRDALNKLRDMRSQRITEVYSNDYIDDMAVTLAAKITGGIVEAKYNSRKNPYITKLVDDLKAKRAEAVKKQKEKYQNKLSELKQKERERAAKREKELSDKYKEQRERGRDSRKRTEFRNKIRKLMSSFQSKLTKPRDGSYVPRELIAQTVDVLNSINIDTGRSVNLSEKIAALRNTYDGLRKDAEAQAVYDDTVSEMLRGLSVSIKNTSIMDMSLEQLQMVYDTLRSLDHYIRESVKMTDTEEKRSAHALGRAMIAETREASGGNKGILSGYVQAQLRADVMFNRLGGFKKNSTWSQMARMLNDGQLHMTQLQMEFSKIFADVLTDVKQLRTLSNTKDLVDIGLVDDDGNKVKITRGMMLSLYMHLLNEDNTRHVMNGGLTVPGMKEYYKGDLTKAFGEQQRSVRVGQIDFTQYAEGIKTVIEEQLTDYEKVWIGSAQYFFDDASRNAINDTTMKLYGFKRATVTNYFPIHTDSNYRAASFESITRDMSLENSGFMKERIKASNPILLEDIVDVINDQIQKVSKYCGLTIPIKNFQKVYGTTLAGYETSLQKEINKKFSGSKSNTSATKYIDNLITDLTSGRQTSDGPFVKLFTAARGNLAKATLAINVRVAIAQAASYPTAAAEIGWKPLLKAVVKGGRSNRMFSRADRAEIEEVSPLLWLRTQGYSNTEIGDIKELRKQKHKIEGKFKKAMGWIEFFDGMTVGRLYYAAQYAVDKKYPQLKRGTEEYKQKVAEVYNDIIEKTQPNYTVMQRPDILRNPNAVVKSLTMFMTQRLQNFNIVYDAAGTYNKYLKDFKAGKNGVTALDVKEAGTKLRRAVVSQLVASTTIVGMKLFADFLLHSLTGYRDDDDEITAESVVLALLNNFADTIFGSVLFGSDLYSLLKSAIGGERYYGISLSGVDSFTDALEKIVNLRKGIDFDSANKAATAICQLMGIPLNNAEKIGKAVYYWSSDLTSEKLFESDVKRTNKQNIHRVDARMSAGDTEEAKEIVNAMIKDKMSQGKTEKEARQSIRTSFTQEYKPRYLDAVNNNNADEIKNIRQLLLNTGVYGSLSDLDKSMAEWRKDLSKKE